MKARRLALAALARGDSGLPAAAADRNNRHPHRDRFDSWWLTHAVTADRIHDHLRKLQRIADRNDDNRSLGTSGYSASVRYVADRLKRAHYKVTIQPFIANLFEEHSDAEFSQTGTDPGRTTMLDTDFTTMTYSGSGDLTDATLVPIDIIIAPGSPPSTSNSGCETADFPAPRRPWQAASRCFSAALARSNSRPRTPQLAGYEGAVIFNEGQPGRTDLLNGTLAEEQDHPCRRHDLRLGRGALQCDAGRHGHRASEGRRRRRRPSRPGTSSARRRAG